MDLVKLANSKLKPHNTLSIPQKCLQDTRQYPPCGQFYFDPFTLTCKQSPLKKDCFSIYFDSMEECQSVCQPHTQLRIEQLELPSGFSEWDQVKCKDNPCPGFVCVDSPFPVSCFTSPCPQFSCYV